MQQDFSRKLCFFEKYFTMLTFKLRRFHQVKWGVNQCRRGAVQQCLKENVVQQCRKLFWIIFLLLPNHWLYIILYRKKLNSQKWPFWLMPLIKQTKILQAQRQKFFWKKNWASFVLAFGAKQNTIRSKCQQVVNRIHLFWTASFFGAVEHIFLIGTVVLRNCWTSPPKNNCAKKNENSLTVISKDRDITDAN